MERRVSDDKEGAQCAGSQAAAATVICRANTPEQEAAWTKQMMA